MLYYLYWGESDFASRWVHRESNLIFIFSSNKDQTKKLALLIVNEHQLDACVCRYKDGKELKPSDKYDLRHEEKDYALFVSDVTDADVGAYECCARNSEGECSATAEVMIASEYRLIWNV